MLAAEGNHRGKILFTFSPILRREQSEALVNSAASALLQSGSTHLWAVAIAACSAGGKWYLGLSLFDRLSDAAEPSQIPRPAWLAHLEGCARGGAWERAASALSTLEGLGQLNERHVLSAAQACSAGAAWGSFSQLLQHYGAEGQMGHGLRERMVASAP